MNSALGKRILALVRDGDYAHAGEEEAIRLVLEPVSRAPDQRLLDVGCGRGGTARFVQDNGWGRVTGFDVEGGSIQRAQMLHPDLSFVVCDVLDVPRRIDHDFDVIYAFNAFYAFPDQAGALRALRSVARSGARLILFDYVDRGGWRESEFAQVEEAAHWRPLQLESFPSQLKEAGWEMESVRTLDDEYARWYVNLVRRIEAKRDEIIGLSDEACYHQAQDLYRLLLKAIQNQVLGGAAVYAWAGTNT